MGVGSVPDDIALEHFHSVEAGESRGLFAATIATANLPSHAHIATHDLETSAVAAPVTLPSFKADTVFDASSVTTAPSTLHLPAATCPLDAPSAPPLAVHVAGALPATGRRAPRRDCGSAPDKDGARAVYAPRVYTRDISSARRGVAFPRPARRT